MEEKEIVAEEAQAVVEEQPIAAEPTEAPKEEAAKEEPAKEEPAREDSAAPAPKKQPKRMQRRKVCVFCVEKAGGIDYKDVNKLKKYVTEKGKILPRRMTGVCSEHQRDLAEAIKKARVMALLPFKGE